VYDFDELDEITEDQEDEGPQPQRRATRIVLWLIVLGLGLLYVPLMLMSGVIAEDNARMESELESIQLTLDAPEQVAPQVQALMDELQRLREQNIALQNGYSEAVRNHVDWPQIMSIFTRYDQTRMALTGISQTGRQVTLTGYADTENFAISYLQQLRDTNQFAAVSLQSITQETIVIPAPAPTGDATRQPDTSQTVANFIFQVDLRESVRDD
jgi:Tfp pilus assembly protein PilN